MSSIVFVTNVEVQANPAPVLSPFRFQVSFESTQALQEDLEWRLIYVGNAEDKSADQELDSVSLGPIPRGKLQFIFVADPPDFTKIVKDEIPGITVVLLSGCYRDQEFVRIGWYLHNIFKDVPLEEQAEVDTDTMELNEMLSKMDRVILADNPRVTRFNIEWDKDTTVGDCAGVGTAVLNNQSEVGAGGTVGVAAAVASTTDVTSDDGMEDEVAAG